MWNQKYLYLSACCSSTLDNAPYGVLWDATRLSQGLAPDLLPGIADESWLNQSQLRQQFPIEKLPDPSSSTAWTSALHSCFDGENAVVFSGKLVKSDNADQFEFKMNPMTMDRSYRLQRRFGADRFLEITISIRHINNIERFVSWLSNQQHYFLGRHWFPFFVKDVSRKSKVTSDSNGRKTHQTDQKLRVYFFASGGDSFRKGEFPAPDAGCQPHTRTTVARSDFLQWAIGLEKNREQPICKLFSRLSLSMSSVLSLKTLC